MSYYSTPNYSVALNAKVGSTSMARAIIRQFYPRLDHLIRTAAFPPGVTEENRPFHWMCPLTHQPGKPVVLLVRDPVDRFLTACQQIGIRTQGVDAAIASLVDDTPFVFSKPDGVSDEKWAKRQERLAKGESRRRRLRGEEKRRAGMLRDDVHFLHQHKLAVGETICFRFPRDIAEAAAFIGIQEPMPERNKAKRRKPTLTAAQAAAVRGYYAADQALFDAVAQPGYVYTPLA